MKTVLLFGTFDRLHPGHEAMLKEAWQHGDKIVVALARDEVVQRLKNKRPRKSFEVRMEDLENSGLVDEVILGDKEEGEYRVLEQAKPDIIAFGYDQTALKEHLTAHLMKTGQNIPTVTLAPFEPERYKSSLL